MSGSGLDLDGLVGDASPAVAVEAFAPGRVNLIGEHTDYAGGLALPMAVHLGTTVTGRRATTAAEQGARIQMRSADLDGEADLSLAPQNPTAVEPSWARYVAGVASELRPTAGFTGEVRTTLPIGSGLSSSAALELACALALGFCGTRTELAQLAQRAEHAASGVPCGLMDQLVSACGVAGHALRIDFATLDVRAVPIPDDVDIVVVHSGEHRTLAGSAYAERRDACERAAARIGPLGTASLDDLAALDDPVLVRRARHVISENQRVDAFIAALEAHDPCTAGEVLRAGHASLRDDFKVSTPTVDSLVERLDATPGVYGVRLTGAGFGGCVVALSEPGALGELGWQVRPAPGARLEVGP